MNRDEEVAGAAALGRDSLAPNPEGLPGWSTRRHLELDAAIQGGNFELGPEHRLGIGDGHRQCQVVALPAERLARLDLDPDQQIAGWPAVASWTALARYAERVPVLDTGGTRTFTSRVLVSVPLPRHTWHGVSMSRPAPRHCGQGWENEKKP